VGFSVSGEVARTLEGLEVAAAAGMHTVAVTADPASRLASSAAALLSLEPGSFQLGPGLAGYCAALLLGAGMAWGYAEHDFRSRLDRCMRELPEALSGWLEIEFKAGSEFAARESGSGAVFLGSGPAYASALYGAAKLVEVSGEYAWGQDVEEWCHLEYFCAEPAMTTVLLSSAGRSASREAELLQAAGAIGRRLLLSRWSGGEGWPAGMAELLSAFALWAAPSGYALQQGEMLGEQPFRGFGGGRSQAEGGGASRIRSSRRLQAGELRGLS